jgi:hypothetical protein
MAAIKIVATSLHQRRSRFAGREPFSDQALPAPQIIDASERSWNAAGRQDRRTRPNLSFADFELNSRSRKVARAVGSRSEFENVSADLL